MDPVSDQRYFLPFQTNQAKYLPHFRPNWPENETPKGGTHPYGQLRVSPPAHGLSQAVNLRITWQGYKQAQPRAQISYFFILSSSNHKLQVKCQQLSCIVNLKDQTDNMKF